MKRVVIEYWSKDSNKTMYTAATLRAYGGADVSLNTIWGTHDFSRTDGRWLAGPCLNFESGAIRAIDEIDASIRSGRAYEEYETLHELPQCDETTPGNVAASA